MSVNNIHQFNFRLKIDLVSYPARAEGLVNSTSSTRLQVTVIYYTIFASLQDSSQYYGWSL